MDEMSGGQYDMAIRSKCHSTFCLSNLVSHPFKDYKGDPLSEYVPDSIEWRGVRQARRSFVRTSPPLALGQIPA